MLNLYAICFQDSKSGQKIVIDIPKDYYINFKDPGTNPEITATIISGAIIGAISNLKENLDFLNSETE